LERYADKLGKKITDIDPSTMLALVLDSNNKRLQR